jgi:hypothetical protein
MDGWTDVAPAGTCAYRPVSSPRPRRGRLCSGRQDNPPEGGNLKDPSEQAFTTEPGRSRSGPDEAIGFIGGMELSAYHTQTGRWTGLFNYWFGMTRRTRRIGYFVLVPGVGVGVVLAWAAWQPGISDNDWLRISKPAWASGTDAGASTEKVIFCVSNVGARSLDFRVAWFECRAKNDRGILATNPLNWVRVPLRPGESTNLTADISLGAVPVRDIWWCCQVEWMERESPIRAGASRLWRGCFYALGLFWEPPWPMQRFAYGTAFASNVEVDDYFHSMYGFVDRSFDWAVRRVPKVLPMRDGPHIPTREEVLEREAGVAFLSFLRESSKRHAEPAAPPNAAPPHR